MEVVAKVVAEVASGAAGAARSGAMEIAGVRLAGEAEVSAVTRIGAVAGAVQMAAH